MRVVVLLSFINLILQQSLIAQVPAFQTRYYTTENGLPSNGIKGLEWDEATGFLWVGTEAGVVRFNGIDFKTFTRQSSPFIGSERISFVIRNNVGTIYAADGIGHVLKVSNNKLELSRTTRLENGGVNSSMYGLIVSERYLEYKLEHPDATSYPVFFTRIVTLDDTSIIVIKQERAYLVTLSDSKAKELDFSKKIKSGFRIGDKLFLVSGDDRVYQADIWTESLVPVQVRNESDPLHPVNLKNARFFWENGYKYPIVIKDTVAWRLVDQGNDIVAEEICSVMPRNVLIHYLQYSEEKKILFIGTDSKGLIVISRNRVDVIKKKSPDINAKNSYYSQVELPGGNVLTSEGDVLGFHKGNAAALPVKGKMSFNVYTTSDSLLWFSRPVGPGAINCLCCYNYKTGHTIEYSRIQLSGNFGLARSGENIYVADDDALGLLDHDSLRYLYKTPREKKTSSSVFDMVELSPGVLCFASCNGLIRYDINTHRIDSILVLPGYCVRSLWKNGDYLFIGTYGKGYYIYSKGKLKAMPLDKNNFLLYTHCFVADKYGYCWISTNRGLFKSNLADIIYAFEHNSGPVYYHYIGRNDGMDITEMNGGCTPCALAMKNETISFPTMDGLVWVAPRTLVPVPPGGAIFIDEVEADSEKIEPDSVYGHRFSAGTQEMTFKLGFSGWCNKENLYLEYQLNDTLNWKPINTDKEAALHLYSLSSGNYRLRIRKLNGFGPGNYSYREINFSINTPWYRQWWFFLLALLLVVGMGILYFKLRTRQYVVRQRKLEQQVFEKTRELQLKNAILEKNDTIKTRLISIISHDIITPLKFLTVAGKNLLQKKELMSEELQQETVREITNTSQELQLLSTNILNWIKYQNENRRMAKETFNVHEMVSQVLGIVQSLARQKNLVVENNVDPSLDIHQFYEPLKILIYNLLTNAIHFTEKGSIVVSASKLNQEFIISVKDEGIGMGPEQVQRLLADQVVITSVNVDNKKGHGLGYLIIKDLVKTMGASLEIESKKESGTTVLVKMPASKIGGQ